MEPVKRVCPKCGKEYTDRPAISREDNVTEICPQCGQKEAIEAFTKYQREKGGKA